MSWWRFQECVNPLDDSNEKVVFWSLLVLLYLGATGSHRKLKQVMEFSLEKCKCPHSFRTYYEGLADPGNLFTDSLLPRSWFLWCETGYLKAAHFTVEQLKGRKDLFFTEIRVLEHSAHSVVLLLPCRGQSAAFCGPTALQEFEGLECVLPWPSPGWMFPFLTGLVLSLGIQTH